MDGALPSQDATLVDDQRTDDDVAEDFAGGQDLEAAGGVHVALDRPADHDIAPTDIALDPAVLADRQVTFGCQVAVHFAVEPDVGLGLHPALELDLVAQHRLGNDGSSFARGSLVEHGNLLASCWRLVPERLRDRLSSCPRKGHAWSKLRRTIEPAIRSTNMKPAVIAIRRRSERK